MATPADRSAILDVVGASGLLEANELATLGRLFDASFAPEGDDALWVLHGDEAPDAVVYAAPELMTEGTWNLRLIAVRPDVQRTGAGSRLVAYAEDQIASRGGRLLVVDTSGDPAFEYVRRFYLSNGFTREAVIREFWRAGDDKVVFIKPVAAGPSNKRIERTPQG